MDQQNNGKPEIKVITASGMDFRDIDYLWLLNQFPSQSPMQATDAPQSPGEIIFQMDIPKDQTAVSMLFGTDAENEPLAAVGEFIKAHTSDTPVTKERGIEIIGSLLNKVLEHRYFELWCNTSRAVQLTPDTKREFREVERMVEAIRFCFSRFMDGLTDNEIFEIVDEFKEKWEIPMFDWSNDKLMPPKPGIHRIDIITGNPKVALFIYSNEPEMKA